MKDVLRGGAEAYVDSTCGAQFALRPLRVRLISVLPHITLGPDLVWVRVYVLDSCGDAVCDRELLVIRPALEQAVQACAKRVVIPQQRQEVSRVDA